jgi:hypothetical protein
VFDPGRPCSFTIATIDLTLPTIIVPLIEHLRRVAPAIDLRVVPFAREDVVGAFDRQEICFRRGAIPRESLTSHWQGSAGCDAGSS